MTKRAMPKSTAKTAYGLLSEIRRLILAEPKRYDQSFWIARRTDGWSRDWPDCGTIGCVAGWVATLKSPKPTWPSGHTEPIAEAVLGLSDQQSIELFEGEALYDRTTARPGTKTYARAGAAHIARFQKKYAKQLKETRV